MTQKNAVYKCTLCGNIAEILHAGAGTLICCGQAMALMAENTADAAREKHVPVITQVADSYKVSVGSVSHPMEEKHWIEFIELIADGKVYRQNLAPGDAPEVTFCLKADRVSARGYCNLHGLWNA
jgi:superoxide reductase